MVLIFEIMLLRCTGTDVSRRNYQRVGAISHKTAPFCHKITVF